MRGVLCFVWRYVVELGKCALYVVVHGEEYIPFLVIPIQFQYSVYFALPIDGYFVMVLD